MTHRRRPLNGSAYMIVLAAGALVLAVTGSAIMALGREAVAQRAARADASARALARGAWCAAVEGAAGHGTGYAGLPERPLGNGTVSVAVSKGTAPGTLAVTAVGSVPGPRGPVRRLLRGVLKPGEPDPSGQRPVEVLDLRLD